MKGIGERLKQERKRLKLTQSALGAIGGVEANAQGHYESGQRLPRADYLFRVAAAGVDIMRVVTGKNLSKCPQSAVPALPELYFDNMNDVDPESISNTSVVKIIGQLRQTLWVTADALCEVTRMVGSLEQQNYSDHVEDHLRALQGDADTFAAMALAQVQKASHEAH